MTQPSKKLNDFALGGFIMAAQKEVSCKHTEDEEGMLMALAVAAEQGPALARPNPTVGCVFFRGGEMIAKGSTELYGKRHAERVALDRLAGLAPGATAYVTLEPCAHHGRQPPCADALVSARIARCVIGTLDPNPLVAGKGAHKLREAGIEVITDVLAKECRAWHQEFLFSHQNPGRILWAAKWAQSADDCLARDDGSSKWISGARARAYSHALRARYGAVMVGAQTLLRDMPALTVRDVSFPVPTQPLRIYFDPSGAFLALKDEQQTKEILARSFGKEAKCLYVVCEQAFQGAQKCESIALNLFPGLSDHVHLLKVSSREAAWDELNEFLTSARVQSACGHPVQSVMVEGGARLIDLGFSQDRFSAVHIFKAKERFGGTKYRLQQHFSALYEQKKSHPFSLITNTTIDDDFLLEGVLT